MRKLLFVLPLLLFSCENGGEESLEKAFLNPASGYSQLVTVSDGLRKTLYVSGQVGAGDNLEEQMRSALENLRSQLEAGGATFRDVVKMNHYIVDYRPEMLEPFRRVRREVMGDTDMPASTLVGVTALFAEGYLIEIDAVAVVPVAED